MGWLWTSSESFIIFDVNYYYSQIDSAVKTGQEALIEYPAPIQWLLTVFRLLAGQSEQTFVVIFVAFIATLDAVATWLVWTHFSRLIASYWIVFIFLIGSLVWFRIDLIPALAVLLALLWLSSPTHRGRPWRSGAAIAIGAATKLWPAMLIFPMLGLARPARRRGLGFLITGVGFGLASLLLAGPARSASPLAWQSERGLQIESLPATLLMWRRTFVDPASYQVKLTQYNAWEIFGPGTQRWLQIGDVAMIAVFVLVGLLGWLIALGGVGLPGHSLAAARDAEATPEHTRAVVLALIAIIMAVLVANKTFSPQYVIWLAGPMAVLIVLPGHLHQRLVNVTLAVLGLITAALTHLIFPLNYGGLLSSIPDPAVTVLLVARNLLVLALTLLSAALAIHAGLRVGRRPMPAA